MSTCVVRTPEKSGIAADRKYPAAYATVGRAGELEIRREFVEQISGQPHHRAEVVAIYAPGTWFSVTYEEAP